MSCRLVSLTTAVLLLAGLAAVAQEREPAQQRRVFVTSTIYDGNLGGLSGADGWCQARALAGGLSNPSSFVAWLSDSTTDAYCHVHGLTGTVAANCGQPELPSSRGPWLRTDGFPFSGSVDEMVEPTNRILAPVVYDEFGFELGDWEGVWTATDPSGEHAVAHPGDCLDWNTSVDQVVYTTRGEVWATAARWTNMGGANCSASHHLLCLETGPALGLPYHTSGGAVAFVTEFQGDGNLGGLDGADGICRGEAVAAGLSEPLSFVAWLSTSTVHAIDRLTCDGPWIRADGVRIADSKADLTDGHLLAPLNVTAAGAYVGPFTVWTGTGYDGYGSGGNCTDWTATAGSTLSGTAPYANLAWSSDPGGSHCFLPAGRLYCFSNVVAVIFKDGFESGDTDGWTPPGP